MFFSQPERIGMFSSSYDISSLFAVACVTAAVADSPQLPLVGVGGAATGGRSNHAQEGIRFRTLLVKARCMNARGASDGSTDFLTAFVDCCGAYSCGAGECQQRKKDKSNKKDNAHLCYGSKLCMLWWNCEVTMVRQFPASSRQKDQK